MEPPRIGWVLRYNYAWRIGGLNWDPAVAGTKSQLGVVMTATPANHLYRVCIAGIIDASPQASETAIEIPHPCQMRLGLGEQRRWIDLASLNELSWPRYPNRPLPRSAPSTEYLGPLPPLLYRRLRRMLLLRVGPGKSLGD